MRSIHRTVLVTVSICTAAALVWMLGAPAHAKDMPDPNRTKGYEVVPVEKDWVTITGTCTLASAIPVPRIEVRHRKHKYTIPSPRVVYDPDHLGLTDCVVFLREIKRGKAWWQRTGYLLMVDDRFLPHVQVLKPETQFKLINPGPHGSGGVRMSRGGVTQLNVLVEPGVLIEPGPGWLEKTGVHVLVDDTCTWYTATRVVAAHPYYSEPTTTTGRYEITQVPPGTYELVCWHGGLQQKAILGQDGRSINRYDFGPDIEVVRKIRVDPDTDLVVDFTVPAPR